jgi:hypothetical protein
MLCGYFVSLLSFVWAGLRSRYSDWLRAGRSGGSNPGGDEISRTCPDRPWGPPSLLYNGYRVFAGGEERPWRDAVPSPPCSAVGHERVELYLYSPYGPYGLYRASVELYLYSPYGPYGLYRTSMPV